MQSQRVLIVGQNASRARILEEGLLAMGLCDVSVVRELHSLLRRIVDADPAVIFIDLGKPDRVLLEQMFQASRSLHRPVAIFVDSAETWEFDAAIDAGVGAYIVDGLRKERVRGVFELCVSRFNHVRRLREELEHARRALAERKVVDRAKGIIMKQRGIDEEQAYTLLRKSAMDNNQAMAVVAQSIITAAALLHKRGLAGA